MTETNSRTTEIVDCSHLAEEKREAIAKKLTTELIDFNRTFAREAKIFPVLLTIEQQGKIAGGLAGRIAWGWMHIGIVWIAPELRGQQIGKSLMAKAEKIARKAGCNGIHLDTFSFQAPDFYLKLGYQVFGTLEQYPPGNCRYFLKKSFNQESSL